MTEIADYYRLMFARVGEGGRGAAAARRRRSSRQTPSRAPARRARASARSASATRLSWSRIRTARCSPARWTATRPAGSTATRTGGTSPRFELPARRRHRLQRAVAGPRRGARATWRCTGSATANWTWTGTIAAGRGPASIDSGRSGSGSAGLVSEEYERKHADRRGAALEPLLHVGPVPACGGARLRPEALAVRVAGRNIAELLGLTVTGSLAFFAGLDGRPERGWRADATARSPPRRRRPARAASRRRPRLPVARQAGGHALGRRGAAHPAGDRNRQRTDRDHLRARRADRRAPPAGYRQAARVAAKPAGCGEHGRRGRARRGRRSVRPIT